MWRMDGGMVSLACQQKVQHGCRCGMEEVEKRSQPAVANVSRSVPTTFPAALDQMDLDLGSGATALTQTGMGARRRSSSCLCLYVHSDLQRSTNEGR